MALNHALPRPHDPEAPHWLCDFRLPASSRSSSLLLAHASVVPPSPGPCGGPSPRPWAGGVARERCPRGEASAAPGAGRRRACAPGASTWFPTPGGPAGAAAVGARRPGGVGEQAGKAELGGLRGPPKDEPGAPPVPTKHGPSLPAPTHRQLLQFEGLKFQLV